MPSIKEKAVIDLIKEKCESLSFLRTYTKLKNMASDADIFLSGSSITNCAIETYTDKRYEARDLDFICLNVSPQEIDLSIAYHNIETIDNLSGGKVFYLEGNLVEISNSKDKPDIRCDLLDHPCTTTAAAYDIENQKLYEHGFFSSFEDEVVRPLKTDWPLQRQHYYLAQIMNIRHKTGFDLSNEMLHSVSQYFTVNNMCNCLQLLANKLGYENNMRKGMVESLRCLTDVLDLVEGIEKQ